VFDRAGLGNPDKYVKIDARYFRPHEVPYLLGDTSKVKSQLNWEPTVGFEELAAMMYDADLEEVSKNG